MGQFTDGSDRSWLTESDPLPLLCRGSYEFLLSCCQCIKIARFLASLSDASLYIKLGKVSVRSSVTLGVADSVANDIIMRMTSQLQ